MQHLGGYGSDDDDSGDNAVPTGLLLRPVTNPIISTALVTVERVDNSKAAQNALALTNPKAEILCAPMQGPKHPYKMSYGNSAAQKRVGMGYIEDTTVDHATFDAQFKSYLKSGYAQDLTTNQVVGDYDEYIRNQSERKGGKRTRNEGSQPALKKFLKSVENEEENEDNSDIDAAVDEEIGDDSEGPWAPVKSVVAVPLAPISSATAAKTSANESVADATKSNEDGKVTAILEPEEDAEIWEKVAERKLGGIMPPRPGRGSAVAEATSILHVKNADQPGARKWILPPIGLKPEVEDETHDVYIPKKCVKKYTGHTKGVQCIEFTPKTGHLLLSGGLDGHCKIWGVYESETTDRNVKRTYSGHTEGVRSINFNKAGTQFLSSGFDRMVRLWDVETGTAVGTFSNRKMGYQVAFAPRDQNSFIMAASDNKIYQWDARSGEVSLEYNYHLGPCNTVTFFDDGKKFLSTSDDKKVLVWEYDTPVPIKYLQDTTMHAIPSLTMHPSKTAIAGQCMDNSIVVFGCDPSVKHLKKKTFRGHNNAGYACQIDFSPNGQYLISGDGSGQLYVWDWKTTKVYRKFQAHEGGPCIGTRWHPLQPSWVATCGWDGVIKLWD